MDRDLYLLRLGLLNLSDDKFLCDFLLESASCTEVSSWCNVSTLFFLDTTVGFLDLVSSVVSELREEFKSG